MKKPNRNTKLTPKIQYIIYIVLLVVFAVWFVIGTQFVKLDSPAVVCFFGMSLPFLGMFGAVGLIARVVWKQRKAKRDAEQSDRADKKQ